MCICVAVILLEGGTELDLKVLDPAETAEGQVKRLAGYVFQHSLHDYSSLCNWLMLVLCT